MRKLLLFISILTSGFMYAQTDSLHKQLNASRKTGNIKIDGDISDKEWLNATKLDRFVEWRPSFGTVELDKNRTEISILYDDQAIYIAGYCHEEKDSISKELVGRDVVGVNDFAGIIFDTYNDKINGFGYYVTPLGEQFDAKYSSDGEISSWNSVYQSEAKIVSDGWTFEMKIPYSAIRFPIKDIQSWGINVTRRRSKSGKQLMWNPVDPNKGGNFLAQFGVINNLLKIKPPIRLSISPYISTYTSYDQDNQQNLTNNSKTINGGLDLKYGINQSFTLDMTLLPDFGQVQSDNRVLNLTPFEVQYNENRTFFTEGTELFNKGGFFYTKRIGDNPFYRNFDFGKDTNDVVGDIKDNPKLINATKISGRNDKGLGIGFFNAITGSEEVTVTNKVTGNKRIVQTDPLTNYNIIVLDKALKNSSSISFINLSTLRAGNDYDANVSSFMWDLYDKKNKWEFFGKYAESQLYGKGGTNTFGHLHTFGIGKVSGNFNFNYWQEAADTKYDQNDLGFIPNNNYLFNGLWMGYKWLKPKWYNNLYYNMNLNYSRTYSPGEYQSLNINTNINGQLKNLWSVGVNFNYNAPQNDFYESRIAGLIYKIPQAFGTGFWIGSNDSKKYSANLNFYHKHIADFNADGYDINLYQQMRFNKKLTISLSDNYLPRLNYRGFANTDNSNSYFGKRTINTIENVLNVKYNFTNKMGLSMKVRHYWASVKYSEYYKLNNDGNLSDPVSVNFNSDYNLNFFNVDLLYTWQFAPGSFIYLNWKNFNAKFDQLVNDSYNDNLHHTLNNPDLQNNTVSLRIVYYLDYLSLKRKKK